MHGRIVNKRVHNRCGAAAVEFALLMPVFLMIVWGIIEFGRAMMAGQLVTNASRHGARLAIVEGSTNSTVEADIDQFLVNSIGGITPADVGVSYEVIRSGVPVGTDLSAAEQKDFITVNVEIDYNKLNLMPIRFLQGVKLKGKCTMRHE